MRLNAFRIKNFRSIVDTGFRDLSPDGISLIVGQNESGKSSILDALNSFETEEITEDDIRSNSDMPEVSCVFRFEDIGEITDFIDEKRLPKNFLKTFKKLNNCITLTRVWESDNLEEGSLVIENDELRNLWETSEKESVLNELEKITVPTEIPAPIEIIEPIFSEQEFVNEVFKYVPMIDMFEDNSLLPPMIDLEDLINKNTNAEGYEGAKNFLLIADIKVEDFKNQSNIRIVGDMIESKCKKVNVELQKYWHQTVGKKDKIEVSVELKNHPIEVVGKQGKPYLTFWIRDKNGRLSPIQRSKGVKWFISFYLKLESTARPGETRRVFLIDEPGANLHAKAQQDILSVFEKQKEKLQIIFTTHSPYLLDTEKVYRVLAVEREDTEDDKSETKVIAFQNLGSASSDTLLPLYTNMGVDASNQSVICKNRNVLLEEISAFFYLKGFWKVFEKQEKVNFLPATGCANLPLLSNLMLGWGLSFSVLVDDDSHGRKVYKELKESCVCPEEKLLKVTNCAGIEDVFSPGDFKKIILKNTSLKYSELNSEFLKKGSHSKVILARDFMIDALNEKVKKDSFSTQTQKDIEALLSKIILSLG